jgi:hypothetical protein
VLGISGSGNDVRSMAGIDFTEKYSLGRIPYISRFRPMRSAHVAGQTLSADKT